MYAVHNIIMHNVLLLALPIIYIPYMCFNNYYYEDVIIIVLQYSISRNNEPRSRVGDKHSISIDYIRER